VGRVRINEEGKIELDKEFKDIGRGMQELALP